VTTIAEIDARLAALGIALDAPPGPAANYVAVRRAGNLLFVSGQLSAGPDGTITGKLGADLDVEAGQRAARAAAIALMAQIKAGAGGSLDRVRSVVQLRVLVNATDNFVQHHLVANGASDLLVEVLGETGRHARAAFGVASLPLGAAVEIEAVVDLIA
jgi:enamine deaminase RidA (YjgF/YER057c/UK114 family)